MVLFLNLFMSDFLIPSKFNATVSSDWIGLSSLLFVFIIALFFFLQSGQLIYEPPHLKLIL